ncbi:MAG: antitoxin family protein [Pyrinomonadaceae bacterium]
MEVRSIQATFEKGVLKPSEDLGLQEHERVRLIVTSESEWERKFAALLEQVQSKTDRFPADEIEADISAAAQDKPVLNAR